MTMGPPRLPLLELRGVGRVINLGDILSGPLQPSETAELLRSRGCPAPGA